MDSVVGTSSRRAGQTLKTNMQQYDVRQPGASDLTTSELLSKISSHAAGEAAARAESTMLRAQLTRAQEVIMHLHAQLAALASSRAAESPALVTGGGAGSARGQGLWQGQATPVTGMPSGTAFVVPGWISSIPVASGTVPGPYAMPPLSTAYISPVNTSYPYPSPNGQQHMAFPQYQQLIVQSQQRPSSSADNARPASRGTGKREGTVGGAFAGDASKEKEPWDGYLAGPVVQPITGKKKTKGTGKDTAKSKTEGPKGSSFAPYEARVDLPGAVLDKEQQGKKALPSPSAPSQSRAPGDWTASTDLALKHWQAQQQAYQAQYLAQAQAQGLGSTGLLVSPVTTTGPISWPASSGQATASAHSGMSIGIASASGGGIAAARAARLQPVPEVRASREGSADSATDQEQSERHGQRYSQSAHSLDSESDGKGKGRGKVMLGDQAFKPRPRKTQAHRKSGSEASGASTNSAVHPHSAAPVPAPLTSPVKEARASSEDVTRIMAEMRADLSSPSGTRSRRASALVASGLCSPQSPGSGSATPALQGSHGEMSFDRVRPITPDVLLSRYLQEKGRLPSSVARMAAERMGQDDDLEDLAVQIVAI